MLLSADPAIAFDCGYAPCTGAPGFAAGFKAVVIVKTLPPSGGEVRGSSYGATVSVKVARRTFPRDFEIVIGAGAPASIATGAGTVVADFSVWVINPASGATLPGPFKPALNVTVKDASIAAGDVVVAESAADHATGVPSARASHGEVVLSLTQNLNFAVVRPAPRTPNGDAAAFASDEEIATTVRTSGGRLSTPIGHNVRVTVILPPHAFTEPLEIDVENPSLARLQSDLDALGYPPSKVVTGFAALLLNQHGKAVAPGLAKSMTIIVQGAGIGAAGEKVWSVTSPTTATPINATRSHHELTFSTRGAVDIIIAR